MPSLRLLQKSFSQPGQGTNRDEINEAWTALTVREGKDAAIVTAGLVGVSVAMQAAHLLQAQGISATVINLPFLNKVDGAWLTETLGCAGAVAVLDNHYLRYGQGDAVCAALAEAGGLNGRKYLGIGLDATPPSGANDEVLARVGLDAATVAQKVGRALNAAA